MSEGPGGTTIGRVSVLVLPDTSRFAKELEAYLNRVEKSLKVEIPVILDTSGLNEDIRKANAAAQRAADKVVVPVEADAKSVDDTLADVQKKASRRSVKLPVTIDQAANAKLLADARKLALSVQVDIPATIEGEQLRRQLQAAVTSLEQLTKIEVPVELEGAAGLRGQVLAAVEQVRTLAAQARPEAEVPVRVEGIVDRSFTSRVKADLDRLAKEAETKIPISVEGENLRTQVREAIARVQGLLEIPVPIEVTEAVQFRRDVVEALAEVAALVAGAKPTVRVEVETELDRAFAARIKADVARLAREAEATIPLDVDGERLRAQINTAIRSVDDLLALDVPLDVADAAEFRRKVADAVARIQALVDSAKPTVDVAVSLDQRFAARIKAQVAKLAKEAEATIPLTVAGESLRVQLREAIERVGNLLQIPVPLELSEATRFRQDVAAALAQVEALVAATRPTVQVDVETELDQAFAARIRRQVADLAKRAEASIPLDVDGERLRAQLEDAIRQVNDLLALPVPVDLAGAAEFRRKVAAALEQVQQIVNASEPTVEIKVGLDQTFASRIKADVARLAREAEATIPLDVEGESLRVQLGQAIAEVERLLKVEVPVELEDAAQLRRDTVDALAAVEALVASVRPEVQVKVDLEDGFEGRIRREVAALVKAAEPEITLDVDGEQLRRDLSEAVSRVNDLLKLPVPIELTEAAEFRAEVVAALAEVRRLAAVANPTVDIDVRIDRKQQFRAFLTGAGAGASRLFSRLDRFLNLTGKFTALQDIFGQLTFLFARFAAIAIALIPAILLLGAGAAALAPAFALALPVLAAIGAAVAAIALGVKAISDGGILDDAAQEALAGLKTQADELTRSLGSLLTAGITPVLQSLSTDAFPVFARGLEDVAVVANRVARTFAAFALSGETLSKTALIFSDITRTLDTLGQAIVPLSSALLSITVAALPGFQQLAEALLSAATRFDILVQSAARSGALRSVISQATTDLIGFTRRLFEISADLIRLLATLEPAARAVFSAVADALSAIFTSLDRAISGFTLSDSIFKPLLDGIVLILSAARELPGQVLDALAPLVQNDQFSRFADNLGRLVLATAQILIQLANSAADTAQALTTAFGPAVFALVNAIVGPLASLAELLARNETLVVTLAAAWTAQYVVATIAAQAATLRLIGTLAVAGVAALGRFVLAVGAVGVALLEVAVAPFAAAIASLFGMSGAALVSAGSMGVLRAAAVTTGTALRALGLALISVQTIATAGLAIAFVGLANGLLQFHQAQERAKADIDQLTSGFNALNNVSAEATIDNLRQIAAEASAVGQGVGTWELGARQFVQAITFGKVDSKFDDIATKGAAAAEAARKLEEQLDNTNRNLAAVSSETGLSIQRLRELAALKGIDLSGAFDQSAPARQKFITDLQAMRSETGLTFQVLQANAGPTAEAMEALSKSIKAAMDATDGAFKTATDLFSGFDPAKQTEKVEKATDRVTKAEQALADARERVAAKKKTTISDAQQIARAQTRLAEAQEGLAKAEAEQSAASLEESFKRKVQQAKDFAAGIAEVTRRGLDPELVSQLLQEGPEKAAPALAALLGKNSKNLITMANDAKTQLSSINQQVLLQQRIVSLVVNSNSEVLARDAKAAMAIVQAEFASGGKASAAELAKSLKLPESEVLRIASEFGIPLAKGVQDAVNAQGPIQVKVGANIAFISGEVKFDDVPVKLGRVTAKAFGGFVDGAGTSRSDSVQALLSKGEFVHQTRAVNYYGRDVMSALNHMAIPRDVLRALTGRQAGLSTKLVANAMRAHAPVADRHLRPVQAPQAPGPVSAQPVHRQVESEPWGRSQSTPLVIVDADGRIQGMARAVSARDHRSRQQAQRLAALGHWGPKP